MTPSEAIIAYAKLLEAIPIRQAETKEEIAANDDKFISAFVEVLNDVSLSADAPLRNDTLSCQT